MIAEIVVSLLLLVGAAFTLIGSIGLVRLPDFFTRLHGPTKATTLGVGSVLVASMLHFASIGAGLELHDVLVSVFLFMTAPVSAHLLSKAGLRQGVPSVTAAPVEAHGHRVGEEGEEPLDAAPAEILAP